MTINETAATLSRVNFENVLPMDTCRTPSTFVGCKGRNPSPLFITSSCLLFYRGLIIWDYPQGLSQPAQSNDEKCPLPFQWVCVLALDFNSNDTFVLAILLKYCLKWWKIKPFMTIKKQNHVLTHGIRLMYSLAYYCCSFITSEPGVIDVVSNNDLGRAP